MNFFAVDSYRELMAEALTGQGNRGRITRAATALNCQRSYLSRVMLGELHLTPDHAYGLTEFLHYGAEEREYFLLLVDRERAGHAGHRRHIDEKIKSIRRRKQSVESRTSRGGLGAEAVDARYFSSWIWSAIHFLTSVPAFQDVDALAKRLELKPARVLHCLEDLERWGLVAQHKHKWIYKDGEFHLSKGSTLLALHHQNWRARALLEALDPDCAGLHYTAVQTVSRKDAERIRELLLDFIQKFSRIAAPSAPEEALVMTLDLFAP